jgi:hypothetical protein
MKILAFFYFVECLAACMNGYLSKLLNLHELRGIWPASIQIKWLSNKAVYYFFR